MREELLLVVFEDRLNGAFVVVGPAGPTCGLRFIKVKHNNVTGCPTVWL